ncbi:MAG: glycerol-3-phosphate 1-O-acyltransferase PlsY [Firmicutes bacterium]|nr:glycerol-3-phosphate 1-O-acyltransferase PlsY [Bacillota bacterium]
MAVLLIILSYLIGSVSFGYLIAKKTKGIDIRKIGSGSTGATNTARALGLKFFVIVLILDALKGLLVILLASNYLEANWAILLCGGAVIIGHNWPIFSNFRGGRGVATTFGVFLGIVPWPALIVFGIFILIILCTRYVSLGSMVGALAIPVVIIIKGYAWEYMVFSLAVSLLLLWRHKPNIRRLLKGEEARFGEKPKPEI